MDFLKPPGAWRRRILPASVTAADRARTATTALPARTFKAGWAPSFCGAENRDKSIISDLPEKAGNSAKWVGSAASRGKPLPGKTVDETLGRHRPGAPWAGSMGQGCSACHQSSSRSDNHPALALKEGAIGERFSARSAKLASVLEEIVD